LISFAVFFEIARQVVKAEQLPSSVAPRRLERAPASCAWTAASRFRLLADEDLTV
jgi:hypothetical protein